MNYVFRSDAPPCFLKQNHKCAIGVLFIAPDFLLLRLKNHYNLRNKLISLHNKGFLFTHNYMLYESRR